MGWPAGRSLQSWTPNDGHVPGAAVQGATSRRDRRRRGRRRQRQRRRKPWFVAALDVSALDRRLVIPRPPPSLSRASGPRCIAWTGRTPTPAGVARPPVAGFTRCEIAFRPSTSLDAAPPYRTGPPMVQVDRRRTGWRRRRPSAGYLIRPNRVPLRWIV